MDVIVIDGDHIGNPQNIDCLTNDLVLDETIHLGINPAAGLLKRLCFSEQPLIQWFRAGMKAVQLLLIVPHGMVVRRDSTQWGSRSETSAALYPAYWNLQDRRRGGLLLQILPAQADTPGITSRHYHRRTVERFYPLYGTTEIRLDNGHWEKLRWQHEVKQQVWHQLRVTSGYAINLIRMDTALPFLSKDGSICMADHYYE